MAAKFFALLTNVGAAKLSNMAALGEKLEITSLAVGDGGGVSPTPSQAQTKLINERRRAPLNSLSVDDKNDSQIIAEQIIPESAGGWWIRKIGLFDADGDLIAIANCPETYKATTEEGSGRTQVIRMLLAVSSTDAVTLKIDPSVVLATRQYVDEALIEVKAYTDKVMGDHVSSPNPHSQYPLTANALKEMSDAGLVPEVLENLGLVNDGSVGRFIGVRVIDTSGTYTPTPGTKKIIVECAGGGGAGGGSTVTTSGDSSIGAGGSEGCYGKSLFVVLESSYMVTIGAGGAPVTGAAGGVGGTTSFGNLLIADGGLGGGTIPAGSAVALAGVNSGSFIPKVTGANISSSSYAGTFIFAIRLNASYSAGGVAGMGGRSIFGDGGGSHTSSGVGIDAKSFAAGGGGAKSWVSAAADVAYPGGKGANGVVIVWEYA
ncbi:phage tail collar domain-containing protein [Enterobacter cloacae]|nr:phage tail collar domain-containing protein [Enterobacter cloacae]VAM08171.1 phage tail collar domain-containing protein [Enterobacter kobei]